MTLHYGMATIPTPGETPDKQLTFSVPFVQTLPYQEMTLHNTDEPADCWCMPESWLIYDEEGEVWYTQIDHHWIQ
mgnify:CR=1 FL=1